MDELFNLDLPHGEHPDIQLCIFPHLKEFLIIDLREPLPQVFLLNTEDVFDEEFFRSLESEFSQTAREESAFPFANLINLPLRMEEIVREVTMTFILEHLGIQPDDEEQMPSVIVFILSGGALAMHSERVIQGLKSLLREHSDKPAVAEWETLLCRLIDEENTALKQLHEQELTEVLRNDSPDYFSLWENRN